MNEYDKAMYRQEADKLLADLPFAISMNSLVASNIAQRDKLIMEEQEKKERIRGKCINDNVISALKQICTVLNSTNGTDNLFDYSKRIILTYTCCGCEIFFQYDGTPVGFFNKNGCSEIKRVFSTLRELLAEKDYELAFVGYSDYNEAEKLIYYEVEIRF